MSTQQMAIPTQPMYFAYSQIPTSMVNTSMPILTTTYQYIGQSGALPPPHNTFVISYSLGGGFTNAQQSQVQPNQDLAQQLHELRNLVHSITNKRVKDFSFEEVYPFPFDKSISMIPFPPNFEIPKFDKYTGETCPITHLKEFWVSCQEVAYNEDYLKRLFT